MADNFAAWWRFCQLPENDGQAADGPGTRWGFILPTWREARRYAQYTDLTNRTFLTQTQQQMAELAETYFWVRQGAPKMAAGVDVSVVDWSWTSGGAVGTIQNELGVADDGVIGPQTLGALAAAPYLIQNIHDWRVAYYDDCGFRTEYPGLYTRADACLALANQLAAQG